MNAQGTTSPHGRWGAAQTIGTLATLLAAALRIPNLHSLPPQAWYDEIWFAIKARELLQTWHLVAHYGIADTAGNAGLVYLTALARLLGIDSMVGARVVTALAGIITVPLAYACLREVFRAEFAPRRRLMAALTALILAVLAMLVILSRIGIEPALAPPVALFSLWQVQLGLRRGQWQHWALAGLVAGLAQYNGPHARFVLPLLGYAIFDALVFNRGSRPAPKRWLAGTGILAAVGTAVNIPLIVTFAQHPDWLLGRAENVSTGILHPAAGAPAQSLFAGSLPALLDNTVRVLGAFTVAGDLNARQNFPGQPMLDGVLGVGFVVGLVWSLWHLRRSATARLMLAWLVIMAIPSALTTEAPNFGRMVGAAVPAAALAVIGWAAITGWVASRPWWPGLDPRIRADVRIVAGLLAAFSLGWNIQTALISWAGSPALAGAFTTESVRAAQSLAERAAAGQTVYVDRLGEVLDEPAFTYIFAGTDVRRVDLRQCVPMLSDPSRQADYVIFPEDDGQAQSLLNVYETINWKKLDILWGRQARFGLAGGALDVTGPRAEIAPGLALIGSKIGPQGTLKPGDTLRVRLFWKAETTIPDTLEAFVHLVHTETPLLEPAAKTQRSPCGDLYPSTAWHPGEVIAFATTLTLPADTPPGAYDVAVGWADPATGLRSLLISADEPLADNRAVIGQVRVGQ